jgi:uncharacterized protein
MAADQGVALKDLIQNTALLKKINLNHYTTEELGLPTLQDILRELARPGLDPRGTARSFQFAEGVNTIEDLQAGMWLPGIVTNITNFGAFVDIGLKNDGLVHVSELRDAYTSNPADVVTLHQEVQVRVKEIDIERGRIQLSMKGEKNLEKSRKTHSSQSTA